MSDSTFRCYIAGAESLLIHCADALIERGHTICGVVTAASQIESWAEGAGIPVLAPGADLAERLSEPFDYFFSITNLSMIPAAVLAKAGRGGINFHDGPLPRYAGLYATAWALMNREQSHGVSWHVMTEGVDEGEVLEQKLFDLHGDETSFVLNTRCYEAGIETFSALIDKIAAGTVAPQTQDMSLRSYFGFADRPAAAASLDWQKPAEELAALVRALDFGPVENPLALAKFRIGDEVVTVLGAEVGDDGGAPGTVVRVDEDALVVATGEGSLALTDLRCPRGVPITPTDLAARHGLSAGSILPGIEQATADRVSEINQSLCRSERFWVKRLETLAPLELPGAERGSEAGKGYDSLAIDVAGRELSADQLTCAVAAFLARVSGAEGAFDVAFRDPALADRLAGAEAFFYSHVPLRVGLDMGAGFDAALAATDAELAKVRKRQSVAIDAVGRFPALRARPDLVGRDLWRVTVEQVPSVDGYAAPAGADVAVAIAADGAAMTWHYDPAVLSADKVEAMQRQFSTFVEAAAQDRTRALAELPILSEAEQRKVLVEWNDTATEFPTDECIHTLFAKQAARTPDAPALAYLDEELTYAQLDTRANQLAHHLVGLGVGPDVLVGVCVERSIDMLVATLGVMKAGGAYVPMDPAYPRDRIALMLEDSQVPVLISQQALTARLPAGEGEGAPRRVFIDSDWDGIGKNPVTAPDTGVGPNNLAYTIYTSGSTGRPKGVMVEHRNVVNFFTGMDERIGHRDGDAPGVWLAVTSLSFDISVLELFWTLARGFKVVLHSDKADDAAIARSRQRHADKPVTFSLMYFASDEGENESSADKYRLLLEGAKFGDANGFEAVWTPERHFHAFGGLYPNPSVAAAALAAITTRIGLRAASVVMPLHHPIRVAEEWSLVDNLSHGRVGISFAAGWQPNDFIIYRPERFENRKQVMIEDIETVRRLWRGETYKAISPLGKEIEVRTLPRPVQKELPFWVTAAGNPETFRAAGEMGANVLTHLLGQSVDEVAEKIKIYRDAWAKAGHPGESQVTIMLHTFVGPDADEVKETVREPMKAYLRSSVQLIKAAAWTFPTFKQKADATGKTPAQVFEEEDLSPEDLEAVLDHAFGRYYETSGLFGTPASCLDMVDRLKGIGVDDIGCLLDYGVPSSKVMAHLKYLGELKALATQDSGATPAADYSFAAQVERHGVTHLQCTPSQMSMLLAGEETRAAMRGLKQVMVGGEAFPAALAADLRAATDAAITNMYGPTETTIWSATQAVAGDGAAVPIGRPIANTQLYVLDSRRQPVPVGAPGELYIGGAGVVRGYYQRPELTAERFVKNPWGGDDARMYRTGDLARFRSDGILEFLGRVDFQVKLRGYRIELGEIESYIGQVDGVREVVVIAREDVPGDKRLVAYIVPESGGVDAGAIRDFLRAELPDYMVPSHFVELDKFPLTPNAKVDRKALPAPDKAQARAAAAYVAPAGELEQSIATVWAEVLDVAQVGMDDNFFDLGGHSLLMVQMHRRVKELVDRPLALTDLFRFPTVRTLVEFLQGDGGSEAMEKSKDRAEARKAARSRRAAMRDRRRK
ncbi:MupA/Atu3671 family FMN-dependent luciferase-like monooxygenase [Haliangium sp.]|uniref:MupA/Atu3671 family FMN-dependent luciferase-like monooxygenase n=1 Tax=Haliangium sp. TaxID=2663208 RepID=UPI003D0DB6A9